MVTTKVDSTEWAQSNDSAASGTSKVLIVDDDAHVAGTIYRVMRSAGYWATTAATAEEGLALLEQYQVDMVVLDLCLPGMSGDEMLAAMRTRGNRARVLVLSVISDPLRKVELLRHGADDYMTKPYNVHELLARTETLLAHARLVKEQQLHLGPIVLDPITCEARSGERTQHLSPSQSQLLALLLERAPFGVSAGEIRSKVHPYGHRMSHAACKVLVSSLRKSLKVLMAPPPKIVWRRGEGWAITLITDVGA